MMIQNQTASVTTKWTFSTKINGINLTISDVENASILKFTNSIFSWEDLIAWYMETVEEDIQNEAQLVDQQHMVQQIIMRMINKDRVILVYRESDDALKPERRVLMKHPNYPVGQRIAS